jgi:hypothetical protein
MEFLQQYGLPGMPIAYGSSDDPYTINGSNSPLLDDNGVQTTLENAINARLLPRPDNNILYMLYLPAAIQEFSIPGSKGMGYSCNSACLQTHNCPDDPDNEGFCG